MPLIVGPVRVDPDEDYNFPGANDTETPTANYMTASYFNRWGTFHYSGTIFEIGDTPGIDVADLDNHIRVRKSINGGLTWSTCDSAHEPLSELYVASASQVGNVVYIALAHYDGGGTIYIDIQSFDLTTETYSSPGPALYFGDGELKYSMNYVARSDGAGVLFYGSEKPVNGHNCLMFAVYSGTAWTSHDTVLYDDDPHRTFIHSGFIGPTDIAHCFFGIGSGSSGPARGLYWVSVDASGTASSVVIIDAFSSFNFLEGYVGDGLVFDSKLWIPVSYPNPGDGGNVWMSVFIGDSETSPTFTQEFISNQPNGNQSIYLFKQASLVPEGSNLHLLWNGPYLADHLNYMYLSTRSGGTWSAAVQIFDSGVINATIVDPALLYWLHNINPMLIAPGTFGIGFDQTGSHTMYYIAYRIGTPDRRFPQYRKLRITAD